ncbi:MAG TPA: sugar porter family MFS transporter [Halococcus sp.]|nr:sugar porter family MFS transporter [Halococcus sp.]
MTQFWRNVFSGDGETNRFVYITAAVAALNGLLFGFDTGVISGALLYIENGFGLSALLQEFVVSSVLVGAVLGAALGGRLADRFGRRRVTLLGAVTFFVSSLGMALSPTVSWLIGWRFIVGTAIGVASIVGPLHISETAPPKIRGSLGSLQQLAITLGILLAYLVNYVFASFITGPAAWRWMLGFGVVPATALGVGMYYLPESPRWLIKENREDEARETLSRLRTETEIDDEIQEMKELESVEKSGFSVLFEPWIRPALIVGVGLAILQQATGINAVLYYAPTIFSSIGLGSLASILATVGIGIVNVAATLIAIRLVDRSGRRPLLLVSVTGMTVMLGILGGIFWFSGLSGVVAWVAVVSMILFVAFFAVGLGPVFWLMISEIYPLEVRGSGEGVASVANWGMNLIIAVTFLTLVQTLGRGLTFWLYGIVAAIAIVFVYTQVPETKGRSLEAIEADLRGSASGEESGTTGDWTSEEEIG